MRFIVYEIIYPHPKYKALWESINICVIIFGCFSFVIIHGAGRITLMIDGIHNAWDYLSTYKYRNCLKSIYVCVITFLYFSYMIKHRSEFIALIINEIHIIHEIIYSHWNIRIDAIYWYLRDHILISFIDDEAYIRTYCFDDQWNP